MRFANILYAVGWAGLITALCMMLPLFAAILEGDKEIARNFFVSFVIGLFIAGMFVLIGRPGRKQRAQNNDLILAGLSVWIIIPVIASPPLMGSIQISHFRDALFESYTLFTTTGASVVLYPELEAFPLNLWRHILAWLGGLWTLIFTVAILATLEIGGVSLSASPLLQHDERESITERFSWPALNIARLYAIMSLAIFIGLVITGTSFTDAVCFTLSAISTTGIAPYSFALTSEMNLASQIVITCACLIGAIAIPLWFAARSRPLQVFRDQEFQFFVGLIIVYFIIVFWAYDVTIVTGFLHTASLATTAAFSFLSIKETSTWSAIWMALPIAVGGMALSTAGGLKVLRVLALRRFLHLELSRLAYPSVVIPVHLGERRLEDFDRQAIWTHLVVFLLLIPVFISGFALLNINFETSWVYAYAFLNNSGGILRQLDLIGAVASFDIFEQSLAIGAMILGRLELVLGLALFSPTFWRFSH